MAKNKSRRQDPDQIILNTVNQINGHITMLSSIISTSEEIRTLKFCIDSAKFGGQLSAILMLRLAHDKDFDFLVSLCNSLFTLWETLLIEKDSSFSCMNEKILQWLREEYFHYLDMIKNYISQSEVNQLETDFNQINGNLIEMRYAFLNILTLNFHLMTKINHSNLDAPPYCPHCIASKMKTEYFKKMPEMLEERIHCLLYASRMEAIANHPDLPSSRRELFMERAEDFRSLADIGLDELENYDEFVMQLAEDYACAQVECAALVNLGIFDAKEISLIGGFDEKKLQKLSKSAGIKRYLEAMGESLLC